MKVLEEELKREICDCVRILYGRGLVTSSGGNVSGRLPGSDAVWITPTGFIKHRVEPTDLVKINLEGRVVEGVRKPSKEWPFHVEIFKSRRDVNAVVHAHNPFTMGVVTAGERIQPITVEAAEVLRGVAVLPFREAGSKALGRLVGRNVAGKSALILKRHGVIGVGSSIDEARAVVEVLEEAAVIQTVAAIVKISR